MRDSELSISSRKQLHVCITLQEGGGLFHILAFYRDRANRPLLIVVDSVVLSPKGTKS